MDIFQMMSDASKAEAFEADIKAIDNGKFLARSLSCVKEALAIARQYGAQAEAVIQKHEADLTQIGNDVGGAL